MMQTRCPACATAFRVTPEQLKAKHGKVRCGQCQHVFNALDSLLEALPAEPESDADSLPEMAPAADHALPPVAEASVAMGELVRSLDGFTKDMAEDLAEEVSAKVEPAVEPPPFSVAEMPPIPSDLPSPAVVEPVPAPSVPPVEPAAQPVTESAEKAPAQSTAKNIADPAWIAEDGDASQTEAATAQPRRAWPWALAVSLCVLLLLMQVLVQFRVELAVLSPESKPALQALCANLGCDLSLPQKANLLSIEASDLHPDPRNKGHLVLSATLKNRAPFTQTYPALELTLTDTADQALVRKVLAAAEYLPKNADAAGFAANGELALTLSLVPDGSVNATATGYRLYLFYP